MTIVFFGMAAAVAQKQTEGARRTVARRAVAESVGMCTLSLTREGTGARVVLEGAASCLGEVPGGYCLRDASDVAVCPEPTERTFSLSLARAD
jgi:hypothetical protein